MLLNLLQCQIAQTSGNPWLQTSFLDLVVLADSDTSLVAYNFMSVLRSPPSADGITRAGESWQ